MANQFQDHADVIAPSYEGHHDVVEDATLSGPLFLRTALLVVLGFAGARYISSAIDFWDFDLVFVFLFLLVGVVWSIVSRAMRSAIVGVTFKSSHHSGQAGRSSESKQSVTYYDSAWKRFSLDFIGLVGYIGGLVAFAYIGSYIYFTLASEWINGAESALLVFFFTAPLVALYWLMVKSREDLLACHMALQARSGPLYR